MILPFGFSQRILVAALLSAFASPSFSADTLPDAGQLDRTLRENEEVKPFTPPPLVKPEEKTRPSGPTAPVSRFTLKGVTRVDESALQEVLKPYIGRQLTMQELEEAVARVTLYYRDQGWIVRAWLPEQDISGGVVTIEVLEGTFGKIGTLSGPDGANLPYIARIIQQGMKQGDPLSSTQIERNILIADDLAGLSVKGALKTGANISETDIDVTVENTPFVDANLTMTNYGSRTTGDVEARASFSLNNMSGSGDRVTTNLTKTRGLDSVRLGYDYPLTDSGLIGNFNASYLHYAVLPKFSSLEAEGESYTAGASLSYPWVRSAISNVYIGISLDGKETRDKVLDDVLVRRKSIRSGSIWLNGDHTDAWKGGGYSSWNIALTGGQVDLSGEEVSYLADLAGPHTHGNFAKLSGSASRSQVLPHGLYLRGRINGQLANSNLDSSEELSLGGPSGVRAYPSGEGSGDQGVLGSLELHKPLPAYQASVFGFVDAGLVRVDREPYAASLSPNRFGLAGYGMGVSWSPDKRLTFMAIAAAPIGSNEQAANGKNLDGSEEGPRLWAAVTLSF